MKNSIERVLLTEQEIQSKVSELGEKISKDYAGKDLLLVVILKGSVIFGADLMRAISIPVEIDFLSVSSYGKGAVSSGVVTIKKDLNESIEGKHILIIEDILDSGNTLFHLSKMLNERNPASMEICTLLNKPDRREAKVNPKYSGYSIPDEFVVGYGLDYAEKFRNLPYIGILKREVYEK
ncbi:MAG: hypoxanthine phosphoribosyltransferase [Clostridia bacterium]|nr:hypoxanthine phosphoribosyltransferase [Clostridia bacterium]